VTTAAGLRPVAREDAAPALAHGLGPIRPAFLAVRPDEDGCFGIDVRWHGRECILRAVVVRRTLTEAGFEARSGNSRDGRTWELRVGRVPSDRVAKVIDCIIW
jgi:hypothetical protein